MLNAVVSFTCWSRGSCMVYVLYVYCLRVEGGLTRLHVGGGVGMSLYRVRVGVGVFVPFQVECSCTVEAFHVYSPNSACTMGFSILVRASEGGLADARVCWDPNLGPQFIIHRGRSAGRLAEVV